MSMIQPAAVEEQTTVVDWSKIAPKKNFLSSVILSCCTGSFLFGMNISLLNTARNHIAWEFGWCDISIDDVTGCTKGNQYSALINVAVFIGAAIGALTGGGFLKFGRRGMLLMSIAVFIFGTISSVVSNSFAALIWARLVVGYGVGLVSCVIPIFMSESTPKEQRGKYGVFHQLFITVGILIGTLIGLPMNIMDPVPEAGTFGEDAVITTFSKVWWRFMLGFAIFPILLCAYSFGVRFPFETPVHYVEQGQFADAEELLKRLAGRDDVTADLAEIRETIEEAQKAQDAGMTLGQAWKANKEYRWVIFFGALLSAFQQFGGINVFVASSSDLFTDAGLSGSMATVMANVMNLLNVVMTFPAVPLIEKLGRKTLLLWGCVGMTCAVLPGTILKFWDESHDATMWVSIIGCLVFIVFFASTYGPVLWVYLFEIYPAEIKGAAAGLATAINWVAGIVMVYVTQFITGAASYLVFTVMCGLSALIVLFWMKETKGRALGDSPYITKAE